MKKKLLAPPHSQSGQIGVIILLIMVVLLTTGLSLGARTARQLALTQQTDESTRVFNAAEAGVEEALSTNFGEDIDLDDNKDDPNIPDVTTGSLTNIDNTTVDYTVTKIRQLQTKLFEGVTVMVDVEGVTNGQQLAINWSKETNCASTTVDPASLLVSIYSFDGTTTRVRHEAIGACNRGDSFTPGTQQAQDGYNWRHNLTLQTNDQFVRIKPVYNDTDIRVTGNGWPLPVQYFNIRSEARNTLGNESRIVEVNRTLPTAPSIMDFAVFSGTTIVK